MVPNVSTLRKKIASIISTAIPTLRVINIEQKSWNAHNRSTDYAMFTPRQETWSWPNRAEDEIMQVMLKNPICLES